MAINNMGHALVIVGCLVIHLVSLIYGISFPSWILWIVGLLASVTWLIPAFNKEQKKLLNLRITELQLKIDLLREKLKRS